MNKYASLFTSRKKDKALNKVLFVRNGKNLIETIHGILLKAHKFVFLHMYIFDYDDCSKGILDILKNKALSGVDVYILLDGFGSRAFPKTVLNELRSYGIKIDFFSPITAKGLRNIGRRLHQKVILVDSEFALVGGTNISKEFIYPESGPPWLDYACLMEGEAVQSVQRKVKRHYTKTFKKEKASIEMLLSLDTKKVEGSAKVEVLENDYTRLKRQVQKAYHKQIRAAKESIQITATYFLPGRKMLKLLKQAASRGVRVELIFSKLSDIRSYNYGSMYYFGRYLKNGIHVYQWNHAIIHAKIALIDEEIVNIGSYNHNVISQYANVEMNVEVRDKNFSLVVKDEIDTIKSQSEKLDIESYNKLSFFKKFYYFLAYNVATLMDFIQILFIRNKKQNESEQID